MKLTYKPSEFSELKELLFDEEEACLVCIADDYFGPFTEVLEKEDGGIIVVFEGIPEFRVHLWPTESGWVIQEFQKIFVDGEYVMKLLYQTNEPLIYVAPITKSFEINVKYWRYP